MIRTSRWIRVGHAGVGILFSIGCGPSSPVNVEATSEPEGQNVTNRVEISPTVVANLGITFEKAIRGKLKTWKTVSGELEVPDRSQAMLRVPCEGRLGSVVDRWSVVRKGDPVFVLASPLLLEAQHDILVAQGTLEHIRDVERTLQERLAQYEQHVHEARLFETEVRGRLARLREMKSEGNALVLAEVIETQGEVTRAAGVALEAEVARDGLEAKLREKRLESKRAELLVRRSVERLSVLTGQTHDELEEEIDGIPYWQSLGELTLRAPRDGVISELFATSGESVESGAVVARLIDTKELLFRGYLPEGDLGELGEGATVLLEFPSQHLDQLTTSLRAPIPWADARARRIRVEATVPNPDGRLVPGLSVMARIAVGESVHEEVLVPESCVVFDGLEAIVFKQVPENRDEVIRTQVEIGARNGEHVEVLAGILDGDLLVDNGIYQLREVSRGKTPQGGHFHADGTWHEDH